MKPGNSFKAMKRNLQKPEAATGGVNTQKVKFSIKNFFSKCGKLQFGHIYWKNI